MARGNKKSTKGSSALFSNESPDKQEKSLESVIREVLSSQSVIDELAKSISAIIFSKFEEFQRETEDKIKTLERSLVDRESRLARAEQRIDQVEQYSRRNCIRIFGIPEVPGEDTDVLVKNITTEHLGLNLPIDFIDRSHRTGRSIKGKTRPLIVKFTRYYDRALFYNNKRKLKGTNITVREDLTVKNLMLLNAAVIKYGRNNVWSSDGNIFYKSEHGSKVKVSNMSHLEDSRVVSQ